MTAVTQRALLVLALASAGCAKSEPPFEDGEPDAATTRDQGRPNASTNGSTDSGATSDVSTAPDTGVDAAMPDLGGGSPVARTLSDICPMTAVSSGNDWVGWANLQYPAETFIGSNGVSEPIFGQTWREGQTDQPGVAEGWEAQLMVGPFGTDPVAQPGCYRALDAEFNVDDGNNDEWWVRVRGGKPGIWSMFYRFRPPGGLWRHGDLNGSDDGVSSDQAARLYVTAEAWPAEIRAVTLNLRCRIDEWDTRFDLVVRGLAAVDPHIVALQEDCSVPGGPSQSSEIAARLAAELDRGYEVVRAITHQAMHPEGTFDEGIALLTAFPINSTDTLDLPFANFPRKAIVASVSPGGPDVLRVVSTHLEFGGGNDDVRDQEAAVIVGEVQGATLVLGDLNTEPSDPAYSTFDAALDDVWPIVGVGDGYTIPASAPVRRIDYVWFSGLTAQSAEVVREAENGVYLSDHLGVSAAFTRD